MIVSIPCQCTNCRYSKFASGELLPGLVAVCECEAGTKSIANLLNGLYDVLYESGVHAFLSGFYSESVLSFTASLERCYEYYVRLFLISQEIDLERIDAVWKEMSNQSERQYGAFLVAYFSIELTHWRSDQGQVKFRNSVIHKGHLATHNETRKYAEYITERLNRIIKSFVPKLSEAEKKLSEFRSGRNHPEVIKLLEQHPDAKVWATALTGQPLLNRCGNSWGSVTFEEAISEKKRRLFGQMMG